MDASVLSESLANGRPQSSIRSVVMVPAPPEKVRMAVPPPGWQIIFFEKALAMSVSSAGSKVSIMPACLNAPLATL